MKKVAFLFLVVPFVASADVWTDIEASHNGGFSMSRVMAKQSAAAWEDDFQAGRGVALLLDGKQSGDYGLARWDWRRGDERQKGWLAVKTDDFGKVVNWWYTEKPPTHRPTALSGQAVDVASTGAALAGGLVEANPLLDAVGFPAASVLKLGGAYVAEQQPMDTCYSLSQPLNAVGWSAGTWNLAALVGAGPAAIVPAVAAGFYAWKNKDPFWRCLPDELRGLSGT
ncbi:MAG: hypothetical protein WBG92_17430 [Thiohalocapsa sp.]